MKKLITLFLLVLLAGCSKESDLPSVGDLEGGTWATECQSSGSTGVIQTATFNGGQYESRIVLYDASCSSARLEVSEIGTYVIGGPNEPGSAFRKLDLKLASLKVKPLVADVANSYNSSTYCGINSWAINTVQDVTGLICGGSQIPPAGAISYDIFMIFDHDMPGLDPEDPGNKRGDLNFGYKFDGNDGTTEDKRPQYISSPAFRKK